MQMADELESQPGGARPGLCLRKALALKQRPDLAKEVDQKLAAARNLKSGRAGIPDAKLPHADQRPRYAKPRGAEVLWPVQRPGAGELQTRKLVAQPGQLLSESPAGVSTLVLERPEQPIGPGAEHDAADKHDGECGPGEIGEQSGQRRRRLPAIENRRTIRQTHELLSRNGLPPGRQSTRRHAGARRIAACSILT